jgi:molecular chaperone DnaJ
MAKRDYYEVLGVGKDASPDEIKKAFRRLAVQHHPDKEGGNETKFKEINEAYEVLKDSEKRKRYDQFGHAGVGGANSGGPSGFEGFNFGGFQGQNVNFDFGDMGLGDIFSSFFGGGQRHQSRNRRGRDIETAIELTFEEAVFGVDKSLKINIEAECEHCKGSGTEPGYQLVTCERCKGSGQVVTAMRTVFGNIQQATVCPVCHGQGKVPEKACSVCRGNGVKRKDVTIDLKIPAGIDDGATIRLREHGEAIQNGPKGDLYVHIRVKPHKKFTREGNLILSHEKINMVDAVLGSQFKVDTVDGPVTMKIPAGTQNGSDFKLSGHGVPNLKDEGRGAHIVTIEVEIPTKLSKKQKELLEEFKNDTGHHGLFS